MKTFITGAAIGVTLLGISFICAYKWTDHTYRHEIGMHQSEMDYVTAELQRRSCDDCELTRTSYGYQCRELKSGKIFKIKGGIN